MKVRHSSGTVVDVPAKKAAKLVEGPWVYVNQPNLPVEALEQFPEGEDTTDVYESPEKASEPQEQYNAKNVFPTIPEMRAWALKNHVEGVRDKGKLPKHAIDAYLAAHKE
jgi:hypothetical protein